MGDGNELTVFLNYGEVKAMFTPFSMGDGIKHFMILYLRNTESLNLTKIIKHRKFFRERQDLVSMRSVKHM